MLDRYKDFQMTQKKQWGTFAFDQASHAITGMNYSITLWTESGKQMLRNYYVNNQVYSRSISYYNEIHSKGS